MIRSGKLDFFSTPSLKLYLVLIVFIVFLFDECNEDDIVVLLLSFHGFLLLLYDHCMSFGGAH